MQPTTSIRSRALGARSIASTIGLPSTEWPITDRRSAAAERRGDEREAGSEGDQAVSTDLRRIRTASA